MSSPEVYQDARTLIADGAAQLVLPVAWPNRKFKPPEPVAPFLAVEVMGDGAEPYELGGGVWVEDGTIEVAVVVPTGTGIEQGLTLRKAVAAGSAACRPARSPTTASSWTRAAWTKTATGSACRCGSPTASRASAPEEDTMAERTFIIRDAAGKEVGQQTLDERFTPILQPGETADPVLTKEEVKAAVAAEKAAAKEEAAAQKAADTAA